MRMVPLCRPTLPRADNAEGVFLCFFSLKGVAEGACERVQVFTGPPESVRDHIMAAARALGRGDWEKAYGFITALKMWAVMPERDGVMAMLKQKLKVEGLRTYLFAYSSQYKALSLSLLANLFQLSEKEVRAPAPVRRTPRRLRRRSGRLPASCDVRACDM